MKEGGADAEAFASAEVPGVAGGCFVVDKHWASYGTERCGVVVEWSIEGFPRGGGGSEGGLAKEIEGEFCLGEQRVPEVIWERSIDASEYAEEVCLERLYGAFGSIGSVDVRGDKLVCCVPVLCDGLAVVLAGLVVEDLVVYCVPLVLEACHDAAMGGDAVPVVS